MLGTIVKVEMLGENVLGVIIGEKEYEYKNPYYTIARSTLNATDEHIEQLKQTSLHELLSFDTSTRVKKQVEEVGEIAEKEEFVEKVKHYTNLYQPLRTIELVEKSKELPKDIDSLHRHIFLEIANDKGVYNIVYSMLAN